MTEEQNAKYFEIAEALIAVAQDNNFIGEKFNLVPEIYESEKDFIKSISAKTAEYAEMKGSAELSPDDLLSMFSFTFAKAGEIASSWRCGQEFNFDAKGLFTGMHELYADEELLKIMKRLPLAESMFNAFSEWVEDNPDFCAENDIHPLLPVLEALRWTFRIGVTLALDFFAKKSS